MANRADITPELCRQLLRYEADTGHLFWLPRRPEQMFAKTVADKIGKSNRWNKLSAGQRAGTVGSRGYVNVTISGVLMAAHRVAWAIHYGVWPKKYIDHIDGDRTNNKINNLRDVSYENYQNLGIARNNTSGVSGVRWDKTRNKWRATVHFHGKRFNLGSFDDIEDAQSALITKRKELGGFTDRHGT